MKTVILALVFVAAAFCQCGPNATLKPIGGGKQSCVPKSTLIGTDASGNVASVATLPGGTAGGYWTHWEKFTVPYTSLTTAGLTQTVTLTTLPASAKLQGLTVKHATAFAGPSVTAMTVSIGGASTTTDFSNPFDVFQTVANTAFLDNGGNTSASTMASQSLTATFTSTGANLGNGSVTSLTAGSVTVWVLWSQLQ